MLKFVKVIAVLAAASLFSAAAVAQGKVAIFNPQAALMGSEAAKTKINALKTSSEYSKLQGSAESIRSELQKLAEEAQKNGVTWSEEQKAEHQRKMNFKRSDFQTTMQKLQAMEQQALQEIQKSQAPKMQKAIAAIAQERKLDLVLSQQVAVFAAEGVDLTAEVVKRMNADK